jgi:hypothetical protein
MGFPHSVADPVALSMTEMDSIACAIDVLSMAKSERRAFWALVSSSVVMSASQA